LRERNMALAVKIASDFNSFVNAYGTPFSIVLKTRSYSGTEYDDEVLASSGTAITGSCLPMNLSVGADNQYIQQGLAAIGDKKVHLPSGTQVAENSDIVFNSGSWIVLPKGIFSHQVEGGEVYKTILVRAKQ
jgi:hypothetical protein